MVGLHLLQGAEVQLHYCDFARNKAAQGAAMTARDPGTSIEAHFTTFWENSASGVAVAGRRCPAALGVLEWEVAHHSTNASSCCLQATAALSSWHLHQQP